MNSINVLMSNIPAWSFELFLMVALLVAIVLVVRYNNKLISFIDSKGLYNEFKGIKSTIILSNDNIINTANVIEVN